VSYYSDSCLLYSAFSLANTPEGFCKSLLYHWPAVREKESVKRVCECVGVWPVLDHGAITIFARLTNSDRSC
jgi:hypothetical protein